MLWNAANPYSALVFKEIAGAAETLEVEAQSLEIPEPADIDAALEAAMGQHANALITVEDPLTIDLRKKIADSRLTNDCHQASECLQIRDF